MPTVFATASTFKRATLRKLGVKYVYDSRTTDFADQILADTDGAGVDVVLNSLTNEGFIEATLRATAPNGRFAEIAKRDIWTPEQMAEARPDIDYEIVALDTVMFTEPERIRALAHRGVGGLGQRRVDAAARRDLSADRGEGRVPPDAAGPPHRQDRGADARIRLQPRADRSYLITGGLGALGLHTAAYLAHLGAGDIVLTSRRAPDADAQRAIDEITERYQCRVHVFSADVGDESEVATLLERIRAELPPLGGRRAPGGRARRRAAVPAERGAVPNDARAQGLRRLPPRSPDRRRRAGLLHRVVFGVGPVRLAGTVQLRDRQRAARRLGRRATVQGSARHRGQLRPVGAGRHGVVGGRDAPTSVPKA